MENSQARVRAHPARSRQQSSVSAPSEPLNSALAAQVQGEADVLAETAPLSEASPEAEALRQLAAKPAPAKKQKRATRTKPTAKPTASFRRLWEISQHQQLYAEEVQRLKTEADRINQVLAERADRKAQASNAATQIGNVPTDPAPKPPAPKASARCQSLRMNQPQTWIVDLSAADDTASLQAQAARIQQLLADLEAAIAQGDAIMHESPAEMLRSSDAIAPSMPDRPLMPKSAVGTTEIARSSQPPQGETANHQPNVWEAAETAAALRHLVRPPRSHPQPPDPRDQQFTQPYPATGRSSLRSTPAKRQRSWRWRQWFQMPQKPLDRLGDAALWIAIAAVVRVSTRWLLTAHPVLTPAIVLLMLAPVAIALYLSVCEPKAGFVPIYRLFLILLGLLLGGRL